MVDVKYILIFLTNKVVGGKMKFYTVPSQLKQGVYDNLKKVNKEYLAVGYEPPTAS
ncbi:hypothetical protein [Lysinibacillus agricola]|uniref:hypothetical protein n=1 Tax=Lysinibacillus agricola TaxID=2590012 RepID=UPI003C1CF311